MVSHKTQTAFIKRKPIIFRYPISGELYRYITGPKRQRQITIMLKIDIYILTLFQFIDVLTFRPISSMLVIHIKNFNQPHAITVI